MRNAATILFLCIISALASSCLEDIDLDTGERILNVYCILGQGPEQTLELSYFAPTGGKIHSVGEDVSISLYEEETLVGHFTRTSDNKWSIDCIPKEKCTYRLEVSVEGEPPLYAETKYPPLSNFHEVIVYPSDYEAVSTITLGNFGVELDADTDQILWCYFENQGAGPAFSQYIVTDHPGVDARGETGYPYDKKSPIIENEFWSTDGFCFYYSSTGVYSSLFYGPPPFLHEQVLRIQHPASFRRPIDPEKMRVYVFDGIGLQEEDGESGMFGIAGVDRTPIWAKLVICSVSGEYDHYLSDFYYGNGPDDDFANFVYKRNHYSNVKNGTGIFGASYQYRLENYIWHFVHGDDGY